MSLIEKASFRTDINALRALAVIGVIGYHFGVPGFGGGYAGVDVFFVISGYLITSQIHQGLLETRFKFGEFYISRLRRIFPALAVMCFCVLLSGWFYILPDEYMEHAKTAFNALYFNSNSGFIKTEGAKGYFDAVTTAVSPLLHTWSLSIEGQFYLFFPLFWVLAYKKCSAHLEKVVFAALVVAMVYFAYDVQHHTQASFYSLSVRVWEFMAGACLVVLPKFKVNHFAANLLNITGLIVLLACGYFFNALLLWPSYWTMIPIVATAFILALPQATWNNWLFNNWGVQKTGDMSYSLYLWHWPLIVFAKQYVTIYDRDLNSVELLSLLAMTYLLAFFSWKFVEKPVRTNRKFWTNKTLLVFTLIVLAGFWGNWRWMSLTKGQPSRFKTLLTPKLFDEMLLPPKYGSVCMEDQRFSIKKENIKNCQINSDKSINPSILLWGDSHMNHYYPVFRRIALDLKINGIFASRGGCHAALPNEYPFGRYVDDSAIKFCIEFNKTIYEEYMSIPSIRMVVLARKWFDGESVDQTISLTKEIIKNGRKVVLVGAIPKPNFNVPQRWIKLQNFSKISGLQLSAPRADFYAVDNINQYVKKQLASEIAEKKVIWIDAMNYICNKQECFFVENGINHFWDDSHLTERKALEFTDEFKRALQP